MDSSYSSSTHSEGWSIIGGYLSPSTLLPAAVRCHSHAEDDTTGLISTDWTPLSAPAAYSHILQLFANSCRRPSSLLLTCEHPSRNCLCSQRVSPFFPAAHHTSACPCFPRYPCLTVSSYIMPQAALIPRPLHLCPAPCLIYRPSYSNTRQPPAFALGLTLSSSPSPCAR